MKRQSSNSIDISNHSDTASKQSHQTTLSNSRMVELIDQRDRVFILSLFTFHSEGIVTPEIILKHQNDIRVYIGIPYKQPEFYIKMTSQEESQK